MRKLFFSIMLALMVPMAAGAQEPYAVLSDDNTVLTFYYDNQKADRNGMDVGPFTNNNGNINSGWDEHRKNITSVVFDTSFTNCTTLKSIAFWFFGFNNLTSITGISHLKTDNVTDMSYMFCSCSALTSLDVSNFKTNNVKYMINMFYNCSSLTNLDVSNFKTENVTYMNGMFFGCSGLTSLDVSNFNTDNVKSMPEMFYGCSGLTNLDVSNFKTDNVTSMDGTFRGCSGLTSLDLGNFKTDNVTNMVAMFMGCSGLTSLDLSNFKTDNVTSMDCMFYGCSGLTSLDLSNFNTDNVTNLSDMFSRCSGLTRLDVSGFKTDKATQMEYMFNACSSLKSLNISGFNTENVTNMSSMFSGCSGLTSLDVSGFKTDNVTDMNGMFYGCSSLTSLDVSGFNTENVTDMGALFANCFGLTNIDVSHFNTSKVKSFYHRIQITNNDFQFFGMFWGCSNLNSLDLSSFDTSQVEKMNGLFYGCTSLSTIYVGNGWNNDKVTSSKNMFEGCTSLVGGAGTHYDANHTDYTYAHIDGGTANPGYFTRSSNEPLVVPTDPEPYAVLSYNNTIVTVGNTPLLKLTFYYDEHKAERNGMDVGPFTYNTYQRSVSSDWDEQRESIKSVVFDASFANCTTLTSTAYWFFDFKNLTSITGISNLKTDNVTDMRSMFQGCSALTSLDLSNFNTENVGSMHSMFDGCSSLTSLDLSNFKTDNVTDMGSMFYNCSRLTNLDLSNFKTDKVTRMDYMFYFCSGLSSLDVSNFKTDKVTDMSYMFWRCDVLASLDLSNFKTDNVENMERMFYGCYSLTSLDLSNFKTDKVTRMDYMFYWCRGLTSLDVSKFKTDNVTSMSHMFMECRGLTSLNVSSFKTDNVTNMESMFSDCSGLTSLDLSNFNTENVTNMSYMFKSCSSLTSLGMTGFKTENVTDMKGMFRGCSSLTSLDVSHFKTDKVTDMYDMFYSCSSLTSLDLSDFKNNNVRNLGFMFDGCSSLTSLDLTNFKTDNVTNMYAMFCNCSSLTSLDLSNFNTENVGSMHSMFAGCSSLTSLDVSNFKTDNVTSMGGMFYGCSGLTSLDLSNFNTLNVKYDNVNSGIESMFMGCTALTTIEVGDGWTTANLTESANVFKDCTQLVGGAGTRYDANHTDYTYAHIDGGTANPGYFTLVGGSQPDPEPDPDTEPWTPQFGSKKLLAITEERGGSKWHSTFEYDEQGRISKYTQEVKGGNHVTNYTYIGDDQIYMDDGIEPITYKLTNGKLTWATIFYDSYANCNISYNGNKMSRIDSDGGYYGEYVWNGDNPSEWIVKSSRGNTVFQAKYTFNNTSTHPLIHALFGLGEYFPSDFDEKLAVYPYLGELPKGLIEREVHAYDGAPLTREYLGPWIINYTYELNSEGDVVKVTKTDEVTCNTTVYTLEWEGGSAIDEDIATTNKGNADYGEGGNINEQTDLNGNVINNVYYNISSSNGGYNSTEGCIVVNTPTKEDDIDGKDIFGEDFKNHFTGIIFKVAAGSGSIKVKAETVGGMLLKVRIGNNEPFEMMMKGNIAATFPYNVDKPTYVYIYAGSLSDMSRTRGSSDSALKIYGIEWESDAIIKGDVNGDDKVNGTDIQAVINVIVDEDYAEEADINKDGKVNGTDIQEIINIIVEEE